MTAESSWQAINPATGESLGEVRKTRIDDVPDLYRSARQGFQSWSTLSIAARMGYLKRLRVYLAAHADKAAKTISKSTGKVQSEAVVNEVFPVLDMLEYVEKNAEKVLGVQPKPTPVFFLGKSSHVEYQPRGVVLVISPWNYPFHLTMIPIINALASGNTVVFKASEVSPMVGQFIEDLFYQVGFPDNVVQAAHGEADLGEALVQEHPDYIFFTGSVRAGRSIQAQAAEMLVPTTIELGGKDPMLVFEDAPFERAVNGCLWGALTNSGQVCMSVERVYVEQSLFERFVERLVEKVQTLSQGTDENADVGAMTSRKQIEIVRSHIEDALAKGAQLEAGCPPDQWTFEDGLFLEPMILTNVNHDMKVMTEETFGPVIPIMAFEHEREAVDLANASEYGLNASVWSLDLEKARRTASRLTVGGVLINDVIVTVANPHLPFGGAKHSGIGRYHGESGLRIFCHEKAVMIDPGRRKSEVSWYPYRGKHSAFLALCRAMYGRRKNWLAMLRVFLRLRSRS